jgi:hypothetical protein
MEHENPLDAECGGPSANGIGAPDIIGAISSGGVPYFFVQRTGIDPFEMKLAPLDMAPVRIDERQYSSVMASIADPSDGWFSMKIGGSIASDPDGDGVGCPILWIESGAMSSVSIVRNISPDKMLSRSMAELSPVPDERTFTVNIKMSDDSGPVRPMAITMLSSNVKAFMAILRKSNKPAYDEAKVEFVLSYGSDEFSRLFEDQG